MKITHASVYLIRWPFKLAVRHNLALNLASDNLVVKISDDQGRSGFGEGIPRSYVTGETTRQAVARLRHVFLPALFTTGPTPDRLSSFMTDSFPDGDLNKHPAATCALETALWDLAGSAAGQSVTDMLGGARLSSLVYSGVLPIISKNRLISLLKLIKSLALTHIKIKVGTDRDEEVVALIRQILGPHTCLRVDANGAWSAEAAVKKIEKLAAYGIEAVEQPVPKEDLKGLSFVKQRVEPMILADESICTAEDARRLIEAGAVDGFNLRLSKCGGFTRTLALLKTARQYNIKSMLGCQVGELGLLSAAGRHFAVANPDLIYLEGALTRFLLGQDIIAEDLTFGQAGKASPLNGKGLGVQVDESCLEQNRLFTLPSLPHY